MSGQISKFSAIDLNRDNKIDRCEWTEVIKTISDEFDETYSEYVRQNGNPEEDGVHSNDSIGNKIVLDTIRKHLGIDLCYGKYLALIWQTGTSAQDSNCSDEGTINDINVTYTDGTNLENFFIFKKYAAQDWWGQIDQNLMSETEFDAMLKQLNDPCRP